MVNLYFQSKPSRNASTGSGEALSGLDICKCSCNTTSGVVKFGLPSPCDFPFLGRIMLTEAFQNFNTLKKTGEKSVGCTKKE